MSSRRIQTLLSFSKDPIQFGRLVVAWRELQRVQTDLGKTSLDKILIQLQASLPANAKIKPPYNSTVDSAAEVSADAHLRTAVKWHEAVRIAARLQRKPAHCLPKTIALVRLLTKRSVPASLHLGVKLNADHMAAHAWTQLGQHPVCEPDSVARTFTQVSLAEWHKVSGRLRFASTGHNKTAVARPNTEK